MQINTIIGKRRPQQIAKIAFEEIRGIKSQ